METKWYSDIWQLVVAPFKRGIPQIVEHGSCRKGFYATVALALVAFVFSNILPALLRPSGWLAICFYWYCYLFCYFFLGR